MNFRKNNLFLLFLFMISTLYMSTLHAEKVNANKKQSINIKADYLLLDEIQGISKYKGNVVFTKETLIIEADTITLFFKDEILIRALILGFPANVQHQPDNEPKVHSQANEMEFFVTEDRLILKGQAFVDQGDRHFSGEYIEYDTQQRRITAASTTNTSTSEISKNNSAKGRVHVIIGPLIDSEKIDSTDKTN